MTSLIGLKDYVVIRGISNDDIKLHKAINNMK